jgi:hypothetical protein
VDHVAGVLDRPADERAEPLEPGGVELVGAGGLDVGGVRLDPIVDELHRLLAGDLPARAAAHAVAHDEQPEAAVGEERVLVVRADPAGVGVAVVPGGRHGGGR